jgi:lipid-A-disaccharide synthase
MIIAGEASGDQHGAKLVAAMQRLDPAFLFHGIGGGALRQAGVRIIVDADQLSVVGITEVFSKLPSLIKGIRSAKRLLKELRPKLLILIDFPDFNLYMAGFAKKLGIPVLYYISPQIWAWRSSRVKKIHRRVDHMAVILPFEEAFYRRHQVPVTYVGHPLLDRMNGSMQCPPQKNRLEDRTVGLLPGSRSREVTTHLPILLEAALRLRRRVPGLKFVVSCAPSVRRALLEEILVRHADCSDFDIDSTNVESVYHQSCLAIAVSGTVTLQAAICGTPTIIIYRVSPLSYRLGRALVRVKFAGLVNLISGKEILPELIQDQASPERIAEKALELLSDEKRMAKMRRELLAVKDELGRGGASMRVAQIANSLIETSPV